MIKDLLLFPALLCLSALASFAFEPPSAADRADALGSLEDEPLILQKLLTPDSDFGPINTPKPCDWLAMHKEPGQPFSAYPNSGFNRPNSVRKIIYILPLGTFSADSSPPLEDLRAYAEAYFQLSVKILPATTLDEKLFKPRINPGTQKTQLHTISILNQLKTQLPPDAFCLLGVTMEDLYPAKSWNYVFGQASLSERVGIYSFARYDPTFFGQERSDNYRQIILQRSCKVLAHETGHMFGLYHCIYFDCLMNGSNNLEETHAGSQHLCLVCLRKLHFNVQFNPVTRYEELAKFYEAHEWNTDGSWTKRQLAKAKLAE